MDQKRNYKTKLESRWDEWEWKHKYQNVWDAVEAVNEFIMPVNEKQERQ